MMTVLIVEDDPMVAELWTRLLNPASRDIRVAGNVPEALSKMGVPPPPDLVLLDLRVPGSTPENTLRHIAELKELNPAAVVLVLTGVSDESLPALARQLGADGFSQKMQATSQDALFGVICDALRTKREGEPAYKRSLELLDKLTGLLMPIEDLPVTPGGSGAIGGV